MRRVLGLATLLSIAGVAHAQTVEFRIVERTGRTAVTGPADAQLNFAVQARALGSRNGQSIGLGGVGFTVHMVGEPEGYGVLARGLICNADHTYTDLIGVSNVVGRGGLASQFTYLSSINSTFNRMLNTTAGGFTNGPDQEIGEAVGAATGTALNTPGIDADGDGNPDGWSGNGTGGTPPNNALANIDPAIMSQYFGADGNWIDVYRFRYTVTNFPSRTILLHLEEVRTNPFIQASYSTGLWSISTILALPISAADLSIAVNDPNLGSCCDPATGACSIVSSEQCAGAFFALESCAAACPAVGQCCDQGGSCSFTFQSFCNSTWAPTGSCSPNPCPPTGACCSYNFTGAPCLVRLHSLCSPGWTWYSGAACSPLACFSGSCCNELNSACTYVSAALLCPPGTSFVPLSGCTYFPCPIKACCMPDTRVCTTTGPLGVCPSGGIAQPVGTACSINSCPGMICCSTTTGACSIIVPAASCPPGSASFGTGTCWPWPCPPLGRCCNDGGVCIVTIAAACPGAWSQGNDPTCTPNTVCPTVGACCNSTTCALRFASGCPASTGAFHGPGSVCGTTANPIACCPANFNHEGGVTVADLFDYLAAWFALDPATDMDGNGVLSVSDLMLFFGLWSAGC